MPSYFIQVVLKSTTNKMTLVNPRVEQFMGINRLFINYDRSLAS